MEIRSRSILRTVGVLLLSIASLAVVSPIVPRAADAHPGTTEIEITAFETPRGVVPPGESAVATLAVRNTGRRERLVWIGMSVQDPAGRWHDIPSHSVTIRPGATSPPQAKGWRVPVGARGFHRVVMAAWSARPGSAGATRLASVDRRDAFRVAAARDRSDRLDTEGWHRGEHRLGRGRVLRENVGAGEGGIALRLPGRRCDGAELRTDARHLHGRYTARLRAADAPGSITAFFLYQDGPDGNDEVDIEIMNDGTRRVLLSVWVAGEQTHTATVRLPFDPSTGLHDYTIDFRPGELRLEADGRLLQRWTTRLPSRPMRVALNAWWPVWLECAPAATDRQAWVEQVRF